MGGWLVSLTRAWWKRVSFWALMLGSSIASMRSKRSSSCLLIYIYIYNKHNQIQHMLQILGVKEVVKFESYLGLLTLIGRDKTLLLI